MKSIRPFLLLLFLLPVFEANAQSYYLMPENFYLKKGDKLALHFTQSEDFVKETDAKFAVGKASKFTLIEGKKTTDLNPMVRDTTSIISFEPTTAGLIMVEMTSAPASNEMSRNKFLRYLGDDDPDNIADKVKNSNQLYYKEKFTNYMKTLFIYDKHGGNEYEKPLGDNFEITLQQNPYKFNYGDDVSAIITYKGKPLVNAQVDLFVKTVTGNVFPQKLSSDADGLVYFKLSREGIYILRTKHYEVSKDKTADYESWRATLTFAFSSANDLPNTYRGFGFGNVH
jgi:hypothetical protein